MAGRTGLTRHPQSGRTGHSLVSVSGSSGCGPWTNRTFVRFVRSGLEEFGKGVRYVEEDNTGCLWGCKNSPAPHSHTPIRGGCGADGAPHLPNLAAPWVRQVRQRGERPGPETVDDTDKGLSPYRIRQLANWYLGEFEEERRATGTVQQDALDAELRAVLAEDGVFDEFIEVEFERVMVAVFAPLGSWR